MIQVPLKKRFKMYESVEKENLEDKNGKAQEMNCPEQERDSTQRAKVEDLSPRTNSPLCSNAESPLTPASSDSVEKCCDSLSSTVDSSSSSAPEDASTSPSTPTAFTPYIDNNKTIVLRSKCPSDNADSNVLEYASCLPAFTVMPSTYLNYLRYNEGARSLGLSSEAVKLLETTATGRKLSAYSSRCNKDKRHTKRGNGFSTNDSEEHIEIEGLLNGNDCARKRKAPSATELKDEQYWDKRRRNNASAKRSRDARRARELETQFNFAFLLEENRKLRAEIAVLREENTNLRGIVCETNRTAK